MPRSPRLLLRRRPLRVGNVGVEPTSVLLPKQAAHPEPCSRWSQGLEVWAVRPGDDYVKRLPPTLSSL